jgi:hypothetical protein
VSYLVDYDRKEKYDEGKDELDVHGGLDILAKAIIP